MSAAGGEPIGKASIQRGPEDSLSPAGIPTLLTVKEVMQKLRIGQTLIYKLMNTGELPYVKISGTRRIVPSAVEAFIRGNTWGVTRE